MLPLATDPGQLDPGWEWAVAIATLLVLASVWTWMPYLINRWRRFPAQHQYRREAREAQSHHGPPDGRWRGVPEDDWLADLEPDWTGLRPGEKG